MNSKFSFLSLLFLALFSAQLSFANEPAEALTRRAVSDNTTISSAAIAELRSLGPVGLQALMVQYSKEIDRHIADPSLAPDEEWERITTALDAVAQQKNSYLSGLYWHTDLETARKASAASAKPILSLRLLGKLTDEFSCANSRFFRTVLYPNAEIASVLRDRFVLHWESVRPVPTITIDFGDGRKLERTLTGNSIHYILDSEARPIDALPGLYGPKAFLRGVNNAAAVFNSLSNLREQRRLGLLRRYYRERHAKISAGWVSDSASIGGKAPEGFKFFEGQNGEALAIAPLAMTKMETEATILREMASATEELGRITDEESWKKIAQLHSDDAILDSRSISLVKRQNLTLTDEEMARLLQKFQRLIALDTVRNEYMLHSKLYTWLMSDPARHDVQRLNERVYANLFLTPHSDPWLGLFSTDVYTALDRGGVVSHK